MAKSFYHYLMKYRHPAPKDEVSIFANEAFHDHDFPKASSNYDQLSRYLELNGAYLKNMKIFDEAWELYLRDEY